MIQKEKGGGGGAVMLHKASQHKFEILKSKLMQFDNLKNKLMLITIHLLLTIIDYIHHGRQKSIKYH